MGQNKWLCLPAWGGKDNMMGMSYADGPTMPPDMKKKMDARNQAMKARLDSLPQNPVVKKTTSKLTKQMNGPTNTETWAPVDSLVSTAYSDFSDGTMSFKEATTHLGEAITALASKQK
jgi:hypothetical protein